jgi:mannose-6-phosphate isomerase-like protein (cupin superfamily)
MLSFNLNALPSKELFKDVFVRLTSGDELTLNYFELKSEFVNIPSHEHPVEHLVVVLEGEMELVFANQKLLLKKGDSLFVPAKKRHTAQAVQVPVKALEIYNNVEDRYYERQISAFNTDCGDLKSSSQPAR